MYSFKNDYSEGAHSRILNALVETNLEQTMVTVLISTQKDQLIC